MALLRFLELVLGVIAILIIVTQVAIPLMMNRPIFWIFKHSSAQKEIESLHGTIAENELKNQAKDLADKLPKEKKSRKKNEIGG